MKKLSVLQLQTLISSVSTAIRINCKKQSVLDRFYW